MNQFNGIGRLVADPELSYTPQGNAVCRFRLAINRPYKGEQGQQKADFINCIAWRKQAENIVNFLKKGSQVGINGSIQTGSFDGQDGRKVYTWEVNCNSIQFLDNKSNQSGTNNQGNTNYQAPQQNTAQGQYGANHQQQNSTRVDEDPFAKSAPNNYEVQEDDLPF